MNFIFVQSEATFVILFSTPIFVFSAGIIRYLILCPSLASVPVIWSFIGLLPVPDDILTCSTEVGIQLGMVHEAARQHPHVLIGCE